MNTDNKVIPEVQAIVDQLQVQIHHLAKEQVFGSILSRKIIQYPNESDFKIVTQIWKEQRQAITQCLNKIVQYRRNGAVLDDNAMAVFKDANEVALWPLRKWMSHYQTNKFHIRYPRRENKNGKKTKLENESPKQAQISRIDPRVINGPQISKSETVEEYLARGGKITRIVH